ncbi:MAG: hypothetical protein KY443_05020 [Actinobacteria bacterium]|nr:hypothetical protein [Actinomycetota bacterium]
MKRRIRRREATVLSLSRAVPAIGPTDLDRSLPTGPLALAGGSTAA